MTLYKPVPIWRDAGTNWRAIVGGAEKTVMIGGQSPGAEDNRIEEDICDFLRDCEALDFRPMDGEDVSALKSRINGFRESDSVDG